MELARKLATPLGKEKKEAENKKAYAPPRLEKLGDLRSVTLGGSIGPNESGAPFAQGDPFGQLPTPTP